jgi:hypothetical protein
LSSAIPAGRSIEREDFSLVLGGPLYQLLRRTSLLQEGLGHLPHRIIAAVAIAWVPLLMLATVERHLWDGGVRISFLGDIDMHVRLLIAMPLLILAERVVHERMRNLVRQFLDLGLIPDEARDRFDAAIASAWRLRNSVFAELLLLAIVYGVGVMLVWRQYTGMDVSSWYGIEENGRLRPSAAGWWLGCVSIPLVQFLLLRWYYRLFIWGRFLWQVSRLPLRLLPTHPDNAGGLGFLSLVTHAFTPLLLAQGVMLAGMMANRIFYAGATLVKFKLELVGLAVFMVFAVLGPLVTMLPQLAYTKRLGMRNYGRLAQRYAREFDNKWVQGGAAPDEPLLGTSDIQSLADLINSYGAVKSMRMLPFTMQTVILLGVTTLAPVAPLLLTMISAHDLLDRALKIVF